MLRLGALTTVYVNNKNNTAHISKKKKRNKKGKRRGKKKKTLSAKGRGQRGGSVRDLEAVWNWRESQVPTENQIRRLTRWLAAFLSVCRRGGFRSNSSRSPQVTQLLPVSRFQSWNDDRDVSRSDPPPPSLPPEYLPVRSWTNTTTRAGNTETQPPHLQLYLHTDRKYSSVTLHMSHTEKFLFFLKSNFLLASCEFHIVVH